MTDAVLSQQIVEAASVDDPAVLLSQQTVEVVNVGAPPVVLSQFVAEVGNVPNPTAFLSHFIVEVLSSSSNATFDPQVAFFGLIPNWESGITERWSWNTDVQTAMSGDQVRVSLIPEPRLSVDFEVIEHGWSPLLDAILTGWQGKTYYLPQWRDVLRLTAAVTAGATLIAIPTDGYTYGEGGLVAFWTAPDVYEIAEILYVDPGQLTLAAPLADAWAIGTRIAPVRRAWLTDSAQLTRHTGSVTQAALSFDIEAPVPVVPDEWANGYGGPWTRDGYALFDHRPNWAETPKVEYQRRMDYFDNATGVRWKRDPSGRGWIHRTHLHTMASRVTVNRLLAWAAQRRGRAVGYLAPVWESALTITQTTLITDTSIIVTRRDYEQMFGAITGRNYVALRHAGGWILRRVTSASAFSAEEDQLNLDAAIGVALAPSAWLNTVWAERAILSADTLEIKWHTPEVAEATITHEQVSA